MARISIEDARRLGIVVPDDAPRSRSRTSAKGPSPLKGRRSAKGGRHARATLAEAFDVRFHVPLEPKTKERPRTSLSKKEIEAAFLKSGGSIARFKALLDDIKHRTHTPGDTASFEQAVAMIAAAHMRGDKKPYESPVHVDFVFVMTGEDGQWPTDVTDPDLDNMEKAICDALNKVVWKDDRLMVSKRSIKICGSKPGIRVRVRDVVEACGDLLALE